MRKVSLRSLTVTGQAGSRSSYNDSTTARGENAGVAAAGGGLAAGGSGAVAGGAAVGAAEGVGAAAVPPGVDAIMVGGATCGVGFGAGGGEPPNISQAPPAPSTSTPAMAATIRPLRREGGALDTDPADAVPLETAGAGDGATRGGGVDGGPCAPVVYAPGAAAGRAGAAS